MASAKDTRQDRSTAVKTHPKDVDQTSEKKENKTHLFNDYIKQMQFKYKWNDSARARKICQQMLQDCTLFYKIR